MQFVSVAVSDSHIVVSVILHHIHFFSPVFEIMEDDGYDPTRTQLLDDPEKEYQPTCVQPGQFGDSFSDDLSDDDGSENNGITDDEISSPDQEPAAPHVTSSLQPTKFDPGFHHADSENVTHPNAHEDQEYRVEPLLDVTTPAYAPSHTYGSPSESPLTSSVSGGYPSPVSSIQPTILTKEDPERTYRPSLKTETVTTPSSDSSDRVEVHSPTGSVGSPQQAPAVVIAQHSKSPHDVNKDLFEDFDDDDIDDDNKLNEDFEGFERDEQPESQVDGIIADIFGESDAEEEFEGFAENEVEKELDAEPVTQPTEQSVTDKQTVGSDDEGEGEDEFVSDFDRIMARKREQLSRRRRRNRDIDFLNDSDDIILSVISQMKEAAEQDRQLLSQNKPATKKLRMITNVTSLLRRADLKAALIDNGMLSAITDWLAPLPGHTLPNLVIRDTMLTCLREFQNLSPETLQDSGIGKALMYLYKHPRETRENKDRAGRLINEWLRPIFNLTSDYRTLTKEERKQLDYEHLPKRRNIESEVHDHRDINRELDGETRGLLRPSDPGFIKRARVPQPSNKDYIIRPKWRVGAGGGGRTGDDNDEDDEEGGESENQPMFRRRRKAGVSGGFGTSSRIETHIRNLAQTAKQKRAKAARAVTMSIEGRKLSL
ncbi:hypothetical protein CRM22_000055 [Opisthorchis felineus]|uniref:TFIIS N-terminal domain-containing protein n=1 Tax=Opisthorchis felineus TaxID=147828 RepID=A0A4S2MH16_OPIFE|nr:hypothetical protein CRM22_000055 [Opisthorchis felineus]